MGNIIFINVKHLHEHMHNKQLAKLIYLKNITQICAHLFWLMLGTCRIYCT